MRNVLSVMIGYFMLLFHWIQQLTSTPKRNQHQNVSEVPSRHTLANVSDDILLYIASFITVDEHLSLISVSKRFHRVCDHSRAWSVRLQIEFDNEGRKNCIPHASCKEVYKKQYQEILGPIMRLVGNKFSLWSSIIQGFEMDSNINDKLLASRLFRQVFKKSPQLSRVWRVRSFMIQQIQQAASRFRLLIKFVSIATIISLVQHWFPDLFPYPFYNDSISMYALNPFRPTIQWFMFLHVTTFVARRFLMEDFQLIESEKEVVKFLIVNRTVQSLLGDIMLWHIGIFGMVVFINVIDPVMNLTISFIFVSLAIQQAWTYEQISTRSKASIAALFLLLTMSFLYSGLFIKLRPIFSLLSGCGASVKEFLFNECGLHASDDSQNILFCSFMFMIYFNAVNNVLTFLNEKRVRLSDGIISTCCLVIESFLSVLICLSHGFSTMLLLNCLAQLITVFLDVILFYLMKQNSVYTSITAI